MNTKEKSNIILIGMAGAGKSTVGVVVAKMMQKDFVDGDLLIQKETGKGLQHIIDEFGNQEFRRIEEEILMEIDCENSVIAPGGSAIYYPAVIEKFKEKGIVVYLHVSLEEIEGRLSNLATRGVTLEAGQTVADLYAERQPLYEQYADITIESKGELAATARRVMEQVEAFFANKADKNLR
ncbi:MAG: shikimate kinase [Firmicutes bacterium]|nr:shikimate kinase [Bacillota bacterium]